MADSLCRLIGVACLCSSLFVGGCIGGSDDDEGEFVRPTAQFLTASLSPTADTTITNRNPEYASGGSSLLAIGGDNNSYTHHTLIRFNLSGFANSSISSAILYAYVSRLPSPAAGDFLMIKAAPESWTEGAELGNGAGSACVSGATWNRRSCGGTVWGTLGATSGGTSAGYITYFTAGAVAQWANWTVTSSAQSMASGSNYGWVIYGWNEPAIKSARAFNSSESGSNPPRLDLTFTCNSGYEYNAGGPSCAIDYSWCANVTVTNGSTGYAGGVVNGFPTYNSTATTTCSTGYSISGSSTRTCQSNQTWSAANPTCNVNNSYCAYPSVTNGGYSLSGGVGTAGFPSYNSTATYSCSAGYQNNGSASGTCQSNQTWSASASCGAISSYCPALATISVSNGTWGAISGGIAGGTTTSLNAGATYTCATGYTGGGATKCNAGPSWGAVSTCSVSSTWCAAPAISNATYGLTGGLSPGTRSYGATATYACSAGYENLGSATGVCQSNGTWSATSNCQIDATYCGALPSASNGSWGSASGGIGGSTTYSMNAQITYACGTGYSGGGTSTCQSNGTWSAITNCSVVTPWCAASPSSVSNGSYLLGAGAGGLTNTYGATATYSCNAGYSVSGSSVSNCQANQSWSTAPTCPAVASYCPVVPTVTNGTAASPTGGAGGGTTRSLNASVTYTCDAGYSITGSNPITCQSGGAWSTGPTCAVVSNFCGTAPSVTNSTGAPTISGGAAGGSTNSVGASASYACATGYKFSSGGTSTCQTNGSWSTAPTCIVDAAWCAAAPTVTNAGTATLTGGYGSDGTTSYLATATYGCNGGYTGGGTSTCQSNKSWSSSPVCSAVGNFCGSAATISNGTLSSVSGGAAGGSTNSVGATATFACNAGYAFSGGSTSTCQSSGSWTTAPTCAPVATYCAAAPVVTNAGAATISGGAAGGATRSLGATAAYTCNTGYTKAGSDPTCQPGATWSTAPTCTADVAWCSAAPSVTNASAAVVSGGVGGGSTPSFSATATYGCNGGYSFSGGSTATCQASHAWSTSPTCAVVSNHCGTPPAVTNSASTLVSGGAAGGTTNSVGATATYSCAGGYAFSGGSTATCQSGGSWTAAPTCAPVSNFCGAPPAVTNSGVPTVTGGSAGGATNSVGATATYACAVGYSQVGSNATCQSSGSWTTAPTCAPVNCGAAPIVADSAAASVSGGNGGGATTTYGATAIYACGSGFVQNGSNPSCQSNGSWTAAPTCDDVDECAVLGTCAPGSCNNASGSYSCTCPMGYTEFDGQCIVQNACTEDLDDCLSIAICSSSSLSSWSCSCPSGFTGDGVNACDDVDECASAPLNDCDAAFATCANTPGTYVCGCQAGYSGDGVTTCNAVPNFCGSPNSVANAGAPVVSGGAGGGATNSLSATATYACVAGYSFVAGSTSSCQADGTWSAPPVCAAVPNFCGAPPVVADAASVVVSGGIGGGSTNSLNATAAYTCSAGYSKSGADPSCQAGGAWSAPPSCLPISNFCGAPPAVANAPTPTPSGGVAGGSSYSLAATADYVCDPGYAEIGSDSVCQASGSWSTPPSCVVVANFCGSAPVVANAAAPSVGGGAAGGMSTSVGATATYACDGGFAFGGGSTSTCGASGTWSTAPTCVAVASYCGSAPPVANAAAPSVSGGAAGGATNSVFATAAYVCGVGYAKSGADATCQSTGSWSTPPTCASDPSWCPAAPVVTNASAPTISGGLAGGVTTSLDAVATYSCDIGYAFTGGTTSTCGPIRTWSTAPTCAVIASYCGAPPAVVNAGSPAIAGGLGGGSTTSLDAVASYACDAGYAFVAGSTSTCVAGGSWNGTPACAADSTYCGPPPVVSNAGAAVLTGGASGNGSSSIGATATYVCASGFDLVGSSPTCGAGATWGAAPTCVPRDCGAPPSVTNAGTPNVSGGAGGGATTTYGATAAYVCASGYVLVGANATCEATGTWSATPGCADVDECATNNGNCGSATYFLCTNNVGASPGCADIDECATGNGGCGSATYFVCANNVGADPTCSDIDECATSNGGCGNATYYACLNVVGNAPSCSDIDECATANGGCGNPTYSTCANNVGAPATCADIDECATANGGCGDPTYVVCGNVAGAAATCTDIDECATANGGCGDPFFYRCTNVAVGPQSCADIDECATAHGGCGDATYFTCTNNVGAAPICADIDECATTNGGCGDATWNLCTNSVGATPTCADIDECAASNGGCGDPATRACADQVGGPPICSDVDECLTAMCGTHATCVDHAGAGFDCTCDAGYGGDGIVGCTDVDECVTGTFDCSTTAHSHCANLVPGYSCDCDTGYRKDGSTCVDIDECLMGGGGCGAHEDCVNQVAAAPTCVCEPGYSRNAPTDPCVLTCGEGNRAGVEECDDGNVVAGDGCSPTCAIESGWACYEPTMAVSTCARTCGDGFIQPPQEQCDDGPGNSDTVQGACHTNCRADGCGDGTVDPSEECDDGVDNSNSEPDACRLDCRRAHCGDTVLDPTRGEVCDPGGGVVLDDAICAATPCARPSDAGVEPDPTPRKSKGCGCDVAGDSERPTLPIVAVSIAVLIGLTRRRRTNRRMETTT